MILVCFAFAAPGWISFPSEGEASNMAHKTPLKHGNEIETKSAIVDVPQLMKRLQARRLATVCGSFHV